MRALQVNYSPFTDNAFVVRYETIREQIIHRPGETLPHDVLILVHRGMCVWIKYWSCNKQRGEENIPQPEAQVTDLLSGQTGSVVTLLAGIILNHYQQELLAMIDVHSKVGAQHLNRNAYLYIRQSTLKQLVSNRESAQRQYNLKGRATSLGWSQEQIIVIDSDTGQSGADAVDREGFQRLVAEVGMGHAGIVMGL